MIIKRKSLLVILLSTAVISFVLIITLIGFYLFLSWQQETDEYAYKSQISDLNAAIYDTHIYIKGISARIDTDGLFKNKPVVQGRISNKTNKNIISLELRINFEDQKGRVIFMDKFFPVYNDFGVGIIAEKTGNYLAPGDSISFKHLLENCPKQILEHLKKQAVFVKDNKNGQLNLSYKLEEVMLK